MSIGQEVFRALELQRGCEQCRTVEFSFYHAICLPRV
jgi:hypothetical protein